MVGRSVGGGRKGEIELEYESTRGRYNTSAELGHGSDRALVALLGQKYGRPSGSIQCSVPHDAAGNCELSVRCMGIGKH